MKSAFSVIAGLPAVAGRRSNLVSCGGIPKAFGMTMIREFRNLKYIEKWFVEFTNH